MSDICSQLLILGQGLKIYFLWDEQFCISSVKKNIFSEEFNFNKVNYYELRLIKKIPSVVNFEPVDRLVEKKINEKSRDFFFLFNFYFINHLNYLIE